MKESSPHADTLTIRIQTPRTAEREHSVPLYFTSSFVFDDAEQARALFADEIAGNIYSRYSNPNSDEFVQKLCALEGAQAGIATASGMAAVFASLAALLDAGDHVLASRELFGSTHQHARAARFLDALALLSHSPNLGDTRTIVTHPTSTTHSKLTEAERLAVNIVPGLIRISVGLEHPADIIADIERALERSSA